MFVEDDEREGGRPGRGLRRKSREVEGSGEGRESSFQGDGEEGVRAKERKGRGYEPRVKRVKGRARE